MNIVKGVTYRCKYNVGSPSCDLYGDFIVDCSGGNSSSTKWLNEGFDLIVPTEQMYYGCGSVTFIGERFKTGDPMIDSITMGGCTVNVPTRNTGMHVSPMRTIKTANENSSGILSALICHCVNSEFPPNDSYENLLEWTKTHLPSEYYVMLKSTKVLGPLVPYRRAINQRKFLKSLGNKWPQNYILLGDALYTFNPQYGQGMTHPCRLVREFNKIFNTNYHQLKDISYIFNRRASSISEECWLISTANDWKIPTLKLIQGHSYIYRNKQNRFDKITTSKSALESLPNELLLIIFSYLSSFDLCQTFLYLNNARTQHLLTSIRRSFNTNLMHYDQLHLWLNSNQNHRNRFTNLIDTVVFNDSYASRTLLENWKRLSMKPINTMCSVHR
ncbi:unnamed protein product [Rotaria magnacalcarata]|uniref:F-box domain-containing protein n=1 Tax=Rotaria magnacalcarata TaxID=392030 RepID=A0A816ALF2_9BILA|nr:unnamed protein product [Rotaria magnacalcarata]CAF2137876.1 unnamed protein product [Rotaria magnacalcarata]CAF3950458.1 unnamed protein product [Rotaria magnacalcarata]CAF3968504.1 unnamed protein product [Rotaria magnacalcarata]CAF3976473.1 unnamed protein product [Rotaria magnacalcarata]